MGRHRLAALAAVAIVAVECGGGMPTTTGGTTAAETREVVAAPADARPAPLAGPDDAAPAPAPAPEAAPVPSTTPKERKPLRATVSPVRPDIRINGVEQGRARKLAMQVEGVENAVLVPSMTLSSPAKDGRKKLSTLVVDSHRFRRFTPDVTANEVGVWDRLREGNIVLTAAAANRLDTELGATTRFKGPDTADDLRIGALAANGLPQLADAMVSPEVGRRLGAGRPDTLLVAVAEGVDLNGVKARLQEVVPGEATVLEEPEVQQQDVPASVGSTTLESFSYQSFGDGTIKIDAGWVSRNIVTVTLPLVGTVTCHRAIVDQMAAALREIQEAGLGGEIYQYSGCWVPRHMLWDPSNPISNHAWGLAFDINVPTNQYGATPSMHPGVVNAFRRWGFKWGGDWSTPDGMHFELERVIQM